MNFVVLAGKKYKRLSQKVASKKRDEIRGVGDRHVEGLPLPIPSLPPTMTSCSCIKISYEMKVSHSYNYNFDSFLFVNLSIEWSDH